MVTLNHEAFEEKMKKDRNGVRVWRQSLRDLKLGSQSKSSFNPLDVREKRIEHFRSTISRGKNTCLISRVLQQFFLLSL